MFSTFSRLMADVCWQGICLPFGDRYATGGISSIGAIIAELFVIVVSAGAFVAVLLIVYAGFQYITAGGDSDKVENAQGLLRSSIIGLVLLFISRILVDYIVQLISK